MPQNQSKDLETGDKVISPLNSFHKRDLEEDERRDRTEFLPDDLSKAEWQKYQIRQVYLCMLRMGGDWTNND